MLSIKQIIVKQFGNHQHTTNVKFGSALLTQLLQHGLTTTRKGLHHVPIFSVSRKPNLLKDHLAQRISSGGCCCLGSSINTSRYFSSSPPTIGETLLQFKTVTNEADDEDDYHRPVRSNNHYQQHKENSNQFYNQQRQDSFSQDRRQNEPIDEEMDSYFRNRGRRPRQEFYDRDERYKRFNRNRESFLEKDEYSPKSDFQEDELYSDANTGLNFDKYDNIPVEVTGAEPPEHLNSFDDLNVRNQLMMNIQRCQYSKPTPVQKYALPMALARRDVMSCAQTGSGKTAAFLIPLIQHILGEMTGKSLTMRTKMIGPSTQNPIALILAPTRELTSQIFKESLKFSHRTIVRPCFAYGGASITTQINNIERGCHLLVATPGRLLDLIERCVLSLEDVRYLVLDEADRMLDMGFGPQISKIVQNSDMPGSTDRHTMMFSATFPQEIQLLARRYLQNYLFLTVGRIGSTSENITQNILWVQKEAKRQQLLELIRDEGPRAKVLIFVETKRQADYLSRYVTESGFTAASIHGDRSQRQREDALNSFKNGRTPILVATSVAARGLDIPNVAHVVNYDLPAEIDDYVHRIGRTGRVGNTGKATAFFNFDNTNLTTDMVSLLTETNQNVPEWLQKMSDRQAQDKQWKTNRPHSRFGARDYRQRESSSRKNQWFSDNAPLKNR